MALPKNINAVDVDKLFDYANEAEILLGRSSSFEILEIRKEIFLRYGKEVELNVYVAKYLP